MARRLKITKVISLAKTSPDGSRCGHPTSARRGRPALLAGWIDTGYLDEQLLIRPAGPPGAALPGGLLAGRRSRAARSGGGRIGRDWLDRRFRRGGLWRCTGGLRVGRGGRIEALGPGDCLHDG